MYPTLLELPRHAGCTYMYPPAAVTIDGSYNPTTRLANTHARLARY